jgi:hypothetical protein
MIRIDRIDDGMNRKSYRDYLRNLFNAANLWGGDDTGMTFDQKLEQSGFPHPMNIDTLDFNRIGAVIETYVNEAADDVFFSDADHEHGYYTDAERDAFDTAFAEKLGV